MTEKELLAKMLDTLVKSRKELANIDLGITKKALPDLDKIIEHISAPLMIMVMGEFSTGKSTFINAMVGEEVAAMNATPTTAVITKLCFGDKDKILVHFTDGTEKEYKKTAFKRLTSKTGKKNEDKTHAKIEYVERQLPLDMLQYVTIIDSPGLNDINEKHSDTTKKFVNNADTVFWMFNALHAGSKTEVDAMEALTPRLKPIAIINMMDEIDEEEDDPQEFLNNLRVQLKDKVQAVVGISAKYALEGKLENNEVKNEIGNLKELEQVVRELVLPNRDKFKLNTLMDELGEWFVGIASDLDDATNSTIKLKESDYGKYIDDKAKLQQNKEILLNITEVIKDYCIGESKKYNEQAMYFIGGLYYYGISYEKEFDKAEFYWESAALKNHTLSQMMLGSLYSKKGDCKKAFVWYKKLAEADFVNYQYLIGLYYLQGTGVETNNTQGIYWVEKAANQGNIKAQSALGNYYFNGEGVVHDEQKAAYWYKQAAEQGDQYSQNMLGNFYYHGDVFAQNYQQAVYWYKKSAEQGNEFSQKMLGYCYKKGKGVQQDYQQAVYWFKKAAEQGNAIAQDELGTCYQVGWGVEQDHQQEIHWLKKAAEQGNAISQNKLGMRYYNGTYVVKQDYQQAVNWFKKAAEQGNALAQSNLGSCYATGKGVQQDYQQAVHWFKKAAEQGNAIAQNWLGDCCFNGNGIEQDYQQAVYWFKEAAEQGNAIAQNWLGNCYFNGDGIEQDYQQAIYWFKKAAEQGNALAQVNIGYCYENGQGTDVDDSKALYWYKKAAEQGHANAKNKIAVLEKKKQNNKNQIQSDTSYFEKCKSEAAQGDVDAQYELGVCYSFGEGVAKNDYLAFQCYEKAANGGNARAQYALANFYAQGRVVTKSTYTALIWYKKAAAQGYKKAEIEIDRLQNQKSDFETLKMRAEQGDADAQYELGIYYKGIRGVGNASETAATYWFKLASAQGHKKAEFELNVLTRKNETTETKINNESEYDKKRKNENEKIRKGVIEQLHQEAMSGNTASIFNLAVCYYEGKVVTKNLYEAFVLFKRAAEKGHVNAQRMVGRCYEEGWGTEVNIPQAVYWHKKAAEQGNEDSKKRLEHYYRTKGSGGSKQSSNSDKKESPAGLAFGIIIIGLILLFVVPPLGIALLGWCGYNFYKGLKS